MTESSWLLHPPNGFTQAMAKAMKVDDVADRVFVQRQHLLSAVTALQQHKKTFGICHANVVSS